MSPDTRRHRGAHPKDAELFHRNQVAKLRLAVRDLSWLLSHGYNINSSVKLVGDRHGLRERQRLAIARSACSLSDQKRRREHCVPVEKIANQIVIIDGFNLIITLEAALSNGPLFIGVDGCVRDLSSVHGSYRAVEETERAIHMVGESLHYLGASSVKWLFDRPVSNSARLATRLRQIALQRAWPWEVEVVFNPDAMIISSKAIAITSDSSILDQIDRWADLKTYLLEREVAAAWIIDLS